MYHSDGETSSLPRDESDVEVQFDSSEEEIGVKAAFDSLQSSRELFLREETRLVVLDFLASLPAEELTARNLSTSDPRPTVLKKARHRVKKYSVSDAEAYERRRLKFQRRSTTLRRKLSHNLKSDIETFDQARLRRRESFKYKDVVTTFLAAISNNWIDDDNIGASYEKEETDILQNEDYGDLNTVRAKGIREKYKKRPTKLEIPSHVPSGYCALASPVLSPEGKVAARLEQISQKIMADFPHLLDEPLQIIRSGKFNYKQFAGAARKATFDYRDVGWSKVALLCYFAREVAIGGELDDRQLDLLADYSFRFIQESTAEWIEKQGGWVALELEEEIINKDTLIVKFREQEERDGAYPERRRSWHAQKRVGNSWNVWMKYGLAALAVGVGVCYSLTRH